MSSYAILLLVDFRGAAFTFWHGRYETLSSTVLGGNGAESKTSYLKSRPKNPLTMCFFFLCNSKILTSAKSAEENSFVMLINLFETEVNFAKYFITVPFYTLLWLRDGNIMINYWTWIHHLLFMHALSSTGTPVLLRNCCSIVSLLWFLMWLVKRKRCMIDLGLWLMLHVWIWTGTANKIIVI